MEIVIKKDVDGRFYWIFQAPDGRGDPVGFAESVAHWPDKQRCVDNLNFCRDYLAKAPVRDAT